MKPTAVFVFARGNGQVSLEGARLAKAWTGINAFNGCGFDLVWASGRIWSLLCEDPRTRKSWVSEQEGGAVFPIRCANVCKRFSKTLWLCFGLAQIVGSGCKRCSPRAKSRMAN